MIFKHGRIKVKRFYCFLFIAALFVSCFCLFRAGIVVLYPDCRKKKILPVPAMEAALEVKVAVVQERVMFPVMRMSFPLLSKILKCFISSLTPMVVPEKGFMKNGLKIQIIFLPILLFLRLDMRFLGGQKKEF